MSSGTVSVCQGTASHYPLKLLTALFCNSECLLFYHIQKKIKKFEEKIAGNLYMPGNMYHVTTARQVIM